MPRRPGPPRAPAGGRDFGPWTPDGDRGTVEENPFLRRCGAVDQNPIGRDTCPDCHALVSDLAAHEAWHSRLVADLARAVEKEIHRPTPAGG